VVTGPRVNDLRQQLTTGNVLVIVGAGVSAGASGGAGVASWTGLLLDGCDRVEEVAAARLPQRWGERIREQIESADLDWMLGAAEDITQRLGGRQSGEYRRWLADSFGKLHARERSVIEALAGLGVPVATTNYDGTIEEVSGWQPVTWRDGAKVQQVLRGDRSAVVHLHGYWDEPESVVLGIRSYDAVLGDAAARSLQRAAMSLRTVVFVGFGAGLGDPNFGALLSWAAAAFPDNAYRHFRLCIDDEVNGVSAQHRPQERVAVLSYGAQHSDLAPFLRSLAGPSPGGAAPAASAGRQRRAAPSRQRKRC